MTTQTVHIGSSTSMIDVPDGSVDLFMTSPPYWNLKDYGSPDEIGKSSYDKYIADMNEVWEECYKKGTDNSVLIINVNNRRFKGLYYPIAFDIAENMQSWVLWDIVIWYVPNALPQTKAYTEKLLDKKFEFVLIFTKGGLDYTFHKPRVPHKYTEDVANHNKRNPRGRCIGNVLRIPAYRSPKLKDRPYHVAAYPEELVAFFLECYTDPGDMVCDPFLGSGTTLKVARVMGRNGVGYELNPDFMGLINVKIKEEWEVPDWKELDIIHTASAFPVRTNARRKKAEKKGAN